MRWRISRQHTLSGFEGTEEGGDAEDAVAADGSGAHPDLKRRRLISFFLVPSSFVGSVFFPR